MVKTFIAFSLAGTLSWNSTLLDVGYTRQEIGRTAIGIAQYIDIAAYECRLGVRSEYGWLIGHELHFVSDGEVHGPWLVTDVEGQHHKPHMLTNGLVADIDCPAMVHRRGHFLVNGREYCLHRMQGDYLYRGVCF
jgi:hypothetical protein